MKKFYICLLLLATLAASCHTGSGMDKCGPCPLLNTAILMEMRVRIVDKTTGADLFLAPNSTYKPTDLNVTSSVDGPNFHFVVDSTDTNNRAILLRDFESVNYTLQLANLSADHINVVVGLNDQKCCATTEVKSIKLNDSTVCAPCSTQQVVTIKK
jgi:hypothetical protein